MVLVIAARVRFPAVVKTLALEKKLMLPVLVSPKVKVCLAVVASAPLAERDKAPDVPAEMEAVGIPELTLINPNRALLVALLPSKRSCVVFLSKIEPAPSLNGEPPLATGRMPVM